MCGLAFHFAPNDAQDAARERMAHCLAAMRHRGPDAGGVTATGGAVLGHRRLSIIDLAGSPQPMSDPSARFTLVFNGEIYNYPELRAQLASRWSFASHGDTEVILAGLILDGSAFVSQLEGMFAVAFWDAAEQQLLLARDRMGKKPLFVTHGGPNLSCASEIPALRQLATDPWHEDLDTVADILRYGYPLPGTTAWQEVREILPGHIAHWRPGEALQQTRYWSLQPSRFTGSETDAIELLRDKMHAAVRRRMIADVEVGAFLSGGVDSTLVCAIVRDVLKLPLKTFTIGFPDAAFDERRFARLAADALGTDHHEGLLEAWDESELERLLLKHVGQPFADSSLLPTALVSKIAAQHVKVALSGDGGDELFSGYHRYQARSILRWASRLPRPLRAVAARKVGSSRAGTTGIGSFTRHKAARLLDALDRYDAEQPYVAPLMLSPAQLAALAPELVQRGHPAPGIPTETSPDDIERMMLADALVYLPQDILVKVDRASMAHALETRAPFLDREVVELAFSLPRQWHRRGVQGKRLLRAAFSNRIPQVLWNRRKQGFGVPIHAWFRGSLGDRLLDLAAADATGPLQTGAIREMMSEHRAGTDHGYRLWGIYAYLLWKRENT